MQPHYGLRCLAVCIICIVGPVDLPSLIGSSSTAEPLTAMLEHAWNILPEHPLTTHHSTSLPTPACVSGGTCLAQPPPKYRMNVTLVWSRSVSVCTHV